MNTKLTLRLDDRLIQKAKDAARRSGKSVSELVADYFRLLGSRSGSDEEFTPVVRSLFGAMRNSGMDRDEYRRHLEDKYK